MHTYTYNYQILMPAKTKEENKKAIKDTNTVATAVSDFVVKPKRATSSWIYFNTETVAKLKEKDGLD